MYVPICPFIFGVGHNFGVLLTFKQPAFEDLLEACRYIKKHLNSNA